MNDFFLSLARRFRLLPLLIMVASLTFMVRAGDAVLQMRDLSGSAQAQEGEDKKEQPDKTAEKTDTKPEETLDARNKGPDKPAAPDKETGKPVAPAASANWSDAADTDIDYSTLRKELYQDLLQRRQQLDAKEKTLAQREALLEVSEKEITRKYTELTGLRNEIQALLKKQSEEEDARIDSLVKIYEGMKPKDAARIFNTLDMDIMMDVVGRMSERKSAPIIASMDAERARTLTTLLAEQKKLPELPEDASAPPPAPTN